MAGTAAPQGNFSSIEDALANSNYVEDDELEQDQGQGGPSDAGHDDDRGPDKSQDDQPPSDWKFPDDGEEFDGDPEGDPDEDPDGPPDEGVPAGEQQVRLSDGTFSTVAALEKERAALGSLHEERTRFDQQKQQFGEVSNHVRTMYEGMQRERELLAALANQLTPKRPNPELAYTAPGDFQVLNDAYNRTVEMINQIGSSYHQSNQMLEQQGRQALESFRDEQAVKLVERAPEFGNEEYYSKFWNEAIRGGGRYYGYTAKELSEGMNDHRQYLVFRDALAYRRIKARQNGQRGLPKQEGRPGRRMPALNGQRQPQSPSAAKLAAARKRFNANPTAKNAVDLLPD